MDHKSRKWAQFFKMPLWIDALYSTDGKWTVVHKSLAMDEPSEEEEMSAFENSTTRED